MILIVMYNILLKNPLQKITDIIIASLYKVLNICLIKMYSRSSNLINLSQGENLNSMLLYTVRYKVFKTQGRDPTFVKCYD